MLLEARVRPSRPPATTRASLSRAIRQDNQEVGCTQIWCRRSDRKRSGARHSKQHGHKQRRRRHVFQSEGSTFTATGDGTRVTVESNTAGLRGGGVCSVEGADVLIESGAALVVQNNTATIYYGGGMFFGRGSAFTATGNSTRVTVESNTAGQSGGGCTSMSGAGRAGRKRSGARRSEQHGHKRIRRRRAFSKRGFDLHGPPATARASLSRAIRQDKQEVDGLIVFVPTCWSKSGAAPSLRTTRHNR